MGRIKYNYFKLTIASMKYNPTVTFVLVNVIPEEASYHSHFQNVIQEMGVPNLIYYVITISKWKELIRNKLQIDVPFTTEWFYKLCDFKPTLGHLFSELVDLPSKKYRYWGYADIDLIWGNFGKFAHLFQGDYYFIRTSAHVTVGMAQFFSLDNFTLHIYEQDPEYLRLLSLPEYYNLDEMGLLGQKTSDNGAHSIHRMVENLRDQDPKKYNYPKSGHDTDHLFLEMYENYQEHPIPVLIWSHGDLRVVHSRLSFAAGRDVLFVHRLPLLQSFPKSIRGEVIADMIAYGYLVPNWIPLFTRHMCVTPHLQGDAKDPIGRVSGLHSYLPYNQTCFGKGYHNINK
jgi:hypothetical protein